MFLSAGISPSLILSPTLFNQVATVPSVIVSLSRGDGNDSLCGKELRAVNVFFFFVASGVVGASLFSV
jgi:hypothetical protein